MRSIEAQYNLDQTTLEEIMNTPTDTTEISITPSNNIDGSYRTGGLVNITRAEIIAVLGFEPNVEDDPYKVVNSWAFMVNGTEPCAIWDYKGSHLSNRWSCYDPAGVLPALFKSENFQEGY
jgi:hypothetical protein